MYWAKISLYIYIIAQALSLQESLVYFIESLYRLQTCRVLLVGALIYLRSVHLHVSIICMSLFLFFLHSLSFLDTLQFPVVYSEAGPCYS